MWKNIPTIRVVYGSSHPYADKISIWQGDITRLAVDTVTQFLKQHEDDFDRVVFNVFKDIDYKIYKEKLDLS